MFLYFFPCIIFAPFATYSFRRQQEEEEQKQQLLRFGYFGSMCIGLLISP
jgi:hypothetical protein